MKTRKSRQYRLKARAEKLAETSQTIARAAFELHSTVGPARANISAIAEKAGVQRLTVYRHFPSEDAIFAACTNYAFEQDPPPDAELWSRITDPMARLRTGLSQLFGYYQRRNRLLSNLHRDIAMPVVAAALARRRAGLRRGAAILSAGWPSAGVKGRLLQATIGHAMEYSSWQSLTIGHGLSNAEAVHLAAGWVEAILRQKNSPRRNSSRRSIEPN